MPAAHLGLGLKLACGYGFTCAVLPSTKVKCWGHGAYGELGNGGQSNSVTPVLVSGLVGVLALAAGRQHTCALLSSGAVKCWGLNNEGQVGDGTVGTIYNPVTTPVTVRNIANAVQITAGEAHTCALLSTGTVMCWGGNSYKQLATYAGSQSATPIAISGVKGVIQIACQSSEGACALLATGNIMCWGEAGSLDGNNGRAPTTVSGISNVKLVTAFGCAVLITRAPSSVGGLRTRGQCNL